MPLKALIWDVDGTMAETEDVHLAAFNKAFQEFRLGWNWDRELYGRLLRVAGGKERILHYAGTSGDPLAERPGFEAFVAELHARKTEIYNEMVRAGNLELRPGVARLMEEARRAGVRQAVATTTSLVNVHNLLRLTLGDAAPRWSSVVAGDHVAKKKPDPEVYLEALRQLRLGPGDCLALEDSANGVKAAVAAGIPVVAMPGAYTAEDDFSGAITVIRGFGEDGGPCGDRPGEQSLIDFLAELHARAVA